MSNYDKCVQFLLNATEHAWRRKKSVNQDVNDDVLQVVRITVEVEPPAGVKNSVHRRS